ncbi:MaoC family dehydratase [Nitratireductor aestuarii]|uniref:MaoC family dehydratase n=1 Tax=Nitratireductor aestuarii TaxID=1735103 RepID=A0A916RNY1_9HYPH|nr:MaoC family dehydratase [Nitratireductor aestuarii]GGA63394.1 MaoC family dehydratase [Nitratireductor aestuarii]
MKLVFSSPQDVIDNIGKKLGPTEWLEIDQDRIDMFAKATGDFQWIHVDPEKAKDGPFGRTIAHGYLTMSLINMFLPDMFEAQGAKMGVNYGSDRTRFPAPVPVGSRVRGVAELVNGEIIGDGAVQTTVRVSIEVEGSSKPGCVSDVIGRYYF